MYADISGTDNARLVLGIYGYETYHTFADKAHVIFDTSGHSYITTCKDLILTITNTYTCNFTSAFLP